MNLGFITKNNWERERFEKRADSGKYHTINPFTNFWKVEEK